MITIEQIRAALPAHMLIQARPKDLEHIASKLNSDHIPDAKKMVDPAVKESLTTKPDRYFRGELGLIYRLSPNGDFRCKNPGSGKFLPALYEFEVYNDLTEITKAEAEEVGCE